MDLDKFFNLFFNPKSDFIGSVGDLNEFKDRPAYKIKIFERLILNGLLFKKSVVDFFSQADEDLDMEQVDLAGEFMMYNRAWFWINQLNWDEEQWVEDLKYASNENLLTAIKLCVHYFEEQEEYEKCAFLKKIQDFVEDCLEPQN